MMSSRSMSKIATSTIIEVISNHNGRTEVNGNPSVEGAKNAHTQIQYPKVSSRKTLLQVFRARTGCARRAPRIDDTNEYGILPFARDSLHRLAPDSALLGCTSSIGPCRSHLAAYVAQKRAA